MLLSVGDRLMFNRLRPGQSDLATQVVFEDIMEKVKIGQEEMKDINFKAEGPSVTWNNDAPDIEVEFTKAEWELMKKQITDMDKAKQITPQMTKLAVKITGYSLCNDERPRKEKDEDNGESGTES